MVAYRACIVTVNKNDTALAAPRRVICTFSFSLPPCLVSIGIDNPILGNGISTSWADRFEVATWKNGFAAQCKAVHRAVWVSGVFVGFGFFMF